VCTICYHMQCLHQSKSKVLGFRVFAASFSQAAWYIHSLMDTRLSSGIRMPETVCCWITFGGSVAFGISRDCVRRFVGDN